MFEGVNMNKNNRINSVCPMFIDFTQRGAVNK